MTERISKLKLQLKQEDIDMLKVIVNLMPNFIDPRYMLAIISSKHGKFDTAIQLFDDCINLLETEFYSKLPGSTICIKHSANQKQKHLKKPIDLMKY